LISGVETKLLSSGAKPIINSCNISERNRDQWASFVLPNRKLLLNFFCIDQSKIERSFHGQYFVMNFLCIFALLFVLEYYSCNLCYLSTASKKFIVVFFMMNCTEFPPKPAELS
jgi:hypothetical protein